VISSTVFRQLCNLLNLSLTRFTLLALRSICIIVISALVLLYILRRAIPRLIAFRTVYTLSSVGIGSSYITILLTVKTLLHIS
jgi:hypothetical protein